MVLYGIGIVLAGVLQAHRRFAGPALAPLLSSVVVAVAYLVFAGIGGSPDIEDLSRPAELVLGVGTTLGVVVLSLSLLVPMRGLRLDLRPALRFPVGAAPRVRRLALAGVLTLAGQQAVAAVAIRLANDGAGRHPGRLLRRHDALPRAVGGAGGAAGHLRLPGLAERAETRRRGRLPEGAGPAAVLVVVTRRWRPRRARGGVRTDGPGVPRQRLGPRVAALRDTIVAFAPGLVGYGLVALLTRALYARGLWKAPTVCVVGGWLLAVVADVVLAGPAARATGRWRSAPGTASA